MKMSDSPKPSFFIVGAPKAGTTALHAYLEKHPQVGMSSDKEPNFFTCEEIAKQQLYYRKENASTEAAYRALFHPKPTALIYGEASVSYLFYEGVAEKIKAYQPEAKIIISLRHPVQRAFSHYQMDYSLGLVAYDFGEIFHNGAGHPKTGMYFQQYFQLSDYAPQVERYLNVFAADRVCLLLQEDLIDRPEPTMEKLCSFLSITALDISQGIAQQNVSGAGKNAFIRAIYKIQFLRKLLALIAGEKLRNTIKQMLFSKKGLPKLDPALAAELVRFYQPGLLRLKAMTGLAIDHWIHN